MKDKQTTGSFIRSILTLWFFFVAIFLPVKIIIDLFRGDSLSSWGFGDFVEVAIFGLLYAFVMIFVEARSKIRELKQKNDKPKRKK